MGPRKAELQYEVLMTNVYRDSMVSVTNAQREMDRDIAEMQARYKSEGVAFFTKTLPQFAKAVDTALATGTLLNIQGFRKPKNDARPRFLGTALAKLFDADGRPLAERPVLDDALESGIEAGGVKAPVYPGQPSWIDDPRREAMVVALRALRQVCFFLYKLKLPYTREQQEKVINDFVQTDERLPDEFREPLTQTNESLLSLARNIVCCVLGNVDPLSGIPKHGPGAVATGEKPHQKHQFSRFYTQLDEVFKYDQWFYLNYSHLGSELDNSELPLESVEAGTAKVVLVPKDSRGPRLISCEPLEYQWIQQSLLSVLVEAIQDHPLTKGKVNFTDQTINQRIALEGSRDGSWVTLDMREASDRVSLWLVARLFPERWYEALYASRSPRTKLPDGTIVQLNKFAPMGSAVCFPVEALCFYALSVAAIVMQRHKTVRVPKPEHLPPVFVYGDDIACRHEHHCDVMSVLSKFGLMLNENKCCTHGFFRESCGVDAFLGETVTPVRMRTVPVSGRKPGELVSMVALSNALFEAGMFTSASFIEDYVRSKWGAHIPTLLSGEIGVVAFVRPYASRKAPCNRKVQTRFNRKLHRLEVKGYRLMSRTVMSETDGYPLLLRYMAKMERKRDNSTRVEPLSDELRTGEYPMVKRVKLILTWTPVAL